MSAEVQMGGKTYLHIAIILFFMIGFGFLPPLAQLTTLGMRVLGIFIGCVYAWTVGWTSWPSVFALICLGYSGYASVTEVFSMAFGNQSLLTVVFSLIFCYGIDKTGILTVVARWILSRKFASKGPWSLCLAMWIAASVMSFLVLNTVPAVLLLWSVFYEICNELNLEKKSPYPSIVMVGIVIFGYLGSTIAPYHTFPIMSTGLLQAVDPGLSLNPVAYMLLVLVINIVAIPAVILMYKYVFRPKVSFSNIKTISTEGMTFTPQMKAALFLLIFFVLLLMVPNLMPKSMAIRAWLLNIGLSGAMALIAILMSVVAFAGKPMIDMAEAISKGVPWGLYFLLSAALTISGAISDEKTGVTKTLIAFLSPIFEGKSAAVIMVLFVIIMIIATNLLNNVVCLMILSPLAINFVSQAGGDPTLMMAFLAFCALQGVAMPSGSVCGAMLHGNTQWLTAKDIYKYAWSGELVLAAVTAVIGIPLGMFLWNIF